MTTLKWMTSLLVLLLLPVACVGDGENAVSQRGSASLQPHGATGFAEHGARGAVGYDRPQIATRWATESISFSTRSATA